MFLNQEIDLQINENLLKQDDFDGFLITLKTSLSTLYDHSPSDSHISVEVTKFHAGYKIIIHLASSVLNFSESAVAQSPYSALDKVLVKLQQTLSFWAVQKNHN